MSVPTVSQPAGFFRGLVAAVSASDVRKRVKPVASSGLFQAMTARSASRPATYGSSAPDAVSRTRTVARTASPEAATPACTACGKGVSIDPVYVHEVPSGEAKARI